ncbi:MAG TPA: queuosine precursor transporter, partial [Thermomicrobiales bacterium]|nr:queuosine precursor transporter [Thermomicrobiales bacterium]
TARRVIWLGFACNLLAVGAIALAGALPSPDFWDAQAAYDRILGYTPRLLAASFAAYLVGEFANAAILARMKVLTRGRFLWTRTIGSTIVGEGFDSLVFITIAFAGTIGMDASALRDLIVTQWLIKTGYEVIATPLTYLVVDFLKRVDGVDAHDASTNFNPFAFGGDRGR